MFSFVSEVTPKDVEAKTFGYISTLQLGGATVLLFLGGVFSDIWGIWTPFVLLGVCSFFVVVILFSDRDKKVVV